MATFPDRVVTDRHLALRGAAHAADRPATE
jgi:hypothetical protein